MDFLTAMRAVTEVCEKVNLIGCDVNELCPPCDPTGASTAAACKIIREMLIAVVNRDRKPYSRALRDGEAWDRGEKQKYCQLENREK